MTGRTALILDVDTGIDDSLALLYAAASDDAEFVAATCVSGNIDARQVAINTRAVLELAGRTDVEVALGRETPLRARARDDARDARAAGPRPRRAAATDTPAVRPARRGRHPRGSPAAARRDHPGHARPADQPGHRGPARARAPPPAPRLHADGRRVRDVGQHDPDHRVEHPLRSRGGQDRLPRLGRGVRGRPDHPAAAGARSRRHRAGAHRPRRRRPAGAPGRQHARRFDRAGPRRGPDAGDPVGGEQPGRPLRRRRAALLHGVPRRTTTASTARSSTIRWPSPRRSTGRWSRPRRCTSTSRRAARSRPG